MSIESKIKVIDLLMNGRKDLEGFQKSTTDLIERTTDAIRQGEDEDADSLTQELQTRLNFLNRAQKQASKKKDIN